MFTTATSRFFLPLPSPNLNRKHICGHPDGFSATRRRLLDIEWTETNGNDGSTWWSTTVCGHLGDKRLGDSSRAASSRGYKSGRPTASRFVSKHRGPLAAVHGRSGRAEDGCGRGCHFPQSVSRPGYHLDFIFEISHANSCFLTQFQPEN